MKSAQTASEERAAFRLAADWGRVWEVDRLRPGDTAVQERKLSGDWLLRLEWLPSSPYGGGAYVAYRGVVDTNGKSSPNWKQVFYVYLYCGSHLFRCIGLLSHADHIEQFLQRWFSRSSSQYLLAAAVLFGMAAPAVVPFILRWYGRKNART